MNDMAQREEKVTIYVCDTPDCGTERIVTDPDTLPEGFMGTTTFEHGGGGTTEEWFACTALHIRKSVVAVQAAGNSTNPALPKNKPAAGNGTPSGDAAGNEK